MKLRNTLLAAATGLALAASGSAHAQSLLGDTVDLTYFFPIIGSTIEDDGTQVVSPQASYLSFRTILTTVNANSIVSGTTPQGPTFFGSADFSGVVITDLSHSNIIGVSIDAASNLVGFDLSRVSFTGDSVSLNFEGLATGANTRAIVDIQTAGVPEPTTWAMMISGFGLVGVAARRRRTPAVA
ncbi:MAG TPA: PEPxxWA-CTERM sorting domain-containing protein [Phenylobacterium sp.]|jgi:hypothetical protein|nr:PEPxxWA-CTERM sorting domain-containing protein [Phenylobacterium sp.]